MSEENRLWKWLLIVGVTAVAALVLYPPKDKLKPGIDLGGGTSLIYEIDDTGLSAEERVDLADRVMNILKTRVDPNSQFNLVWRPIGSNRLEIQMPLPPKEARERRVAFEASREKVRALNVTRAEIEQALAAPADQREQALARLERNVTGRREKLAAVATAWDTYRKVRGGSDLEAEINAQAEYEAAVDEVLGTNLMIGRLTDVLALQGAQRDTELDRLKSEYPSYVDGIDKTVVAYDEWSARRGTLEDAADLKRLLRGAGVLEFRVLAERDLSNPTLLQHSDPNLREPIAKYVDQLNKRGPRGKAGDRYLWAEIEDFVKFMQADDLEEAEARATAGSVVAEKYAGKYYVLAHVDEGDQKYGLTQRSPDWSLKRAMPSRDYSTGRPAVEFMLDARGGAQFSEVTRLNRGRELAIFLDGHATSHATIKERIGQRGQISGDFTPERVQEIVRKLEAGSLPARLKETPLHEKNMGPTLGERNRVMGLRAAVCGFIATALFMLMYYWFAGVVANVALFLNLLLVLATMAFMEATFTLPGIAGLVLTVGMAVDANVLINERIRDERARGVALRKAVKTGYEKAFSTILDSNLTTLITCVILGYVGSEEVKGFAMTLGFGIVTSMFTALFVTRLILMTLIDKRLIQSLPMARLVGRPNIDWFGLRRFFWPISGFTVVGGMAIFIYVGATNKEMLYDIEFLGGTSVQLELGEGVEMSAVEVGRHITGVGLEGGPSAAGWLREAAAGMRGAKIEPTESSNAFTVFSDRLSPTEINIILRTTFEDSLVLGGFSGSGTTARFETKPTVVNDATADEPDRTREVAVDLKAFRRGVEEAAAYAEAAAARLESARVQTVSDIGEATDESSAFDVITVEPNKELVRAAVIAAMGDKLRVERSISYVLVTDPQRAPDGLFPIREEHTLLGQVTGGDAPNDIRSYKGGVAMVFDELDPPQTLADIQRRFKEMRLQPQFEKYESREYEIFGLQEAGRSGDGEAIYSKICLVVSDESVLYADDPGQWHDRLAKPELEQAEEALSAEESLRKVVQFAPQIAARTQQQALIALVLALAAIVAYVWFRFGTMQYGLAAIVALVHDVAVVLGAIAVADRLGFGDLRFDLTMVAAVLTVVGYSLNDTIVIFDRIRENRGKLTKISTNIINNSINGTLSRTLLTSSTTLVSLTVLFLIGGPGVHGFSYALLWGIVVGTYSSIAIAAPLLQNRKLLHIVVYLMVAGAAVAIAATLTDNSPFVVVVAVAMGLLVVIGVIVERRLDQPVVAAA